MTANVEPTVAPEDDPNAIICRREKPTGSNMARRVCRTRAEIEAREEKDQDTLRRSRASQTGGGCALSREGC